MPPTSVEIPDDALEILEAKLYDGTRITGEWHGLWKVAKLRDEERGRDLVSDSRSTNGDGIEELKERIPSWMAYDSNNILRSY
jgi:hypothetical protein